MSEKECMSGTDGVQQVDSVLLSYLLLELVLLLYQLPEVLLLTRGGGGAEVTNNVAHNVLK